MERIKIEGAIRTLGLFATKKGYWPLIDLVEQMLNGKPYNADLLRATAELHGTKPSALHNNFYSLLHSVKQNVPDLYGELFGTQPVSTARFANTVAEYVANHI